MRVLVLGGYGLIGLAVVQRLLDAGWDVRCIVRNTALGKRLEPLAEWRYGDIARRLDPDDWSVDLEGIDAVVNAAGALQSGVRDNVTAVHRDGIAHLIRACELGTKPRFVQISAPDAKPYADSAFLRTKGEADIILKRSELPWTILRPGLVIGANAYGGTSLLRMLAAFPVIQPIALAEAEIQTVALSDVAMAVERTLMGDLDRHDFDLVEEGHQKLGDLIVQMRNWLGMPAARFTFNAPRWMTSIVSRLADLAGWFGWRSALRSTSMRVLQDGVTGKGHPWRHVTGLPLKSLAETLRSIPATRQERLYAQAELILPVMLLGLAGFWILSGVIGLVQLDEAASWLSGGFAPEFARGAVVGGSVADMLVGFGLLFRRFARPAAIASIALSATYLLGGTLLIPALWMDPFGPFVKVVPVMLAGLALSVMLEER